MKAIKRVLYFLTSRLFLTSLLILLQLLAILIPLHYIGMQSVYIHSVLSVCSLMLAIGISNDTRHVPFHMTWIFLLLIAPLVGWPLYYLLRYNQQASRTSRRCEAIEAKLNLLPIGGTSPQKLAVCKSHPFIRQMSFLSMTGGFPVYQHTKTQYFPCGESFFPIYLEQLRSARRFIFLEYFIISDGRLWQQVRDILFEKRREGVEIRILYDDIGTIRTISRPFRRELAAKGILIYPFNPYRAAVNSFMNYRDHRKITVIDGRVAFTGGINLADEYVNIIERFGYWKDCSLMLEGDAVTALTHMFIKSWSFAVQEEPNPQKYLSSLPKPTAGLIQPYCDNPASPFHIGRGIYFNMINTAKRYVWITAPYLILEQALHDTLCMAARSGIDVRIITPHIPDKWYVHIVTRSNYLSLLCAGVRIYEYKPGFIHAKTIVVDDQAAMVGTTNFDYCSFYSLFENGVLLYDTDTVKSVHDDIADTFTDSIEMTIDECRSYPLRIRFLQSILRLFSPFL